MDLLQIIGSATGVIGALIMATKIETHAHVAWTIWLISSTSLSVMALGSDMIPLALMQIVFTVINVLGLKNSILIARKKRKVTS